MTARFRPAWGDSKALFRPAHDESSSEDGLTIVTEFDAGNVSASLSSVTDSTGQSPVVWVDTRPAASSGGGWRHLLFAVENAEGKTPIFRLNRETRTTSTSPGQLWLPLYTQDFENWIQAPEIDLVSGSPNYIEFQFADPLPAGRVYISTQPIKQQGYSTTFAEELLSSYSSVASPTDSADESGVFFVSPSETDENGRQIGGHPMYAIRLAWGGSTTDGGRKRKLVMLSGIHAAGEHQSWLCFEAFVRWALDSESAEAVALRANWDIYLYFNLTPNGIYGGRRRSNFRTSSDPNRNFISKTLAEISAVTAAAEIDTSGHADAMFSWHAHQSNQNIFIPGYHTPQTEPVQEFKAIGATVFGVSASNYGVDEETTDVAWGQDVLGATVSLVAEIPQNNDTAIATHVFIGEAWAKTLQAADAAGLFVDVAIDVQIHDIDATQPIPFEFPEGVDSAYLYTAYIDGEGEITVLPGSVAAERAEGITTSAPGTLEALAFVLHTSAASAEALATRSSPGVMSTESVTSVGAVLVALTEAVQAAAAGGEAAAEAGRQCIRSTMAEVEALAGLRPTRVAALEAGGTPVIPAGAAASVALEALYGARNAAEKAIESLAARALSAGGAMEGAASVGSVRGAGLEVLRGLLRSVRGSLEARGDAAAMAAADIAVEAIRTVETALQTASETLAPPASAVMGAEIEALQAIRARIQAATEAHGSPAVVSHIIELLLSAEHTVELLINDRGPLQ